MQEQNNHEKKSFLGRVLSFIGRRAFYLILFLCVAVIGLTAWTFSTVWKDVQGEVESIDLNRRVTSPPLSSAESVWQELDWPEEDEALAAPATATPKPMQETPPVQSEPPETVESLAADKSEPVAEVMAAAFLWPLNGKLEREYAMDRLLYDRTMADWRTHDGLDIAATMGAQVCAVADGVVEQVYTDERMGVTVVLYHGGGLRSHYANLGGLPTVEAGMEVQLGDVLGAVGRTALDERGDVSHLHLGMTLDQEPIDPRAYLP